MITKKKFRAFLIEPTRTLILRFDDRKELDRLINQALSNSNWYLFCINGANEATIMKGEEEIAELKLFNGHFTFVFDQVGKGIDLEG
jgi:hypothetical protein